MPPKLDLTNEQLQAIENTRESWPKTPVWFRTTYPQTIVRDWRQLQRKFNSMTSTKGGKEKGVGEGKGKRLKRKRNGRLVKEGVMRDWEAEKGEDDEDDEDDEDEKTEVPIETPTNATGKDTGEVTDRGGGGNENERAKNTNTTHTRKKPPPPTTTW
jgi:hypothetical protein